MSFEEIKDEPMERFEGRNIKEKNVSGGSHSTYSRAHNDYILRFIFKSGP